MSKFIKEISIILDSFNSIAVSTNNDIIKDQLETIISSIDLKEQVIEVFLQSQNEKLIDVFKKINYSLISGEYISNSNINHEIEEVIVKLSETVNISNDFDDLQIFIFDLISTVKIALESYKTFIQNIENMFSSERIDYLFSFNQQIEKEYNNAELSALSQNLITYFFNNLHLSNTDHFSSIEDNQFEILFKREKYIENCDILQLEEISKLLKLKIGFLEHKWKARKQEENPAALFYLIDNKSCTIEEFKSNNTKLNEWSEIINSHYQLYITNWAHITEKRIKSYRDKPLTELKFLEIHQLIKYYKDVKKTPHKLEEISKYLSEIPKENKHFYNSYAVNVISNYALNNRFSLFLESALNLELIKNEYNSTSDKIKGEINNFFLEFKYLNALLDILDLKINEKENVDFLEYERTITDECKIILDKYFSNKEWSKSNNNYIFLLPFEECLVKIDNNIDIEYIFIASSFILPPDNNKIELQYNKIREKHKSLSYHINTIKRLRKDLNKLDELNNAFDKRDFKSIEIISIYTAMITFILSSIPAYKFIDSVWSSLLFMLSLASSLGIFVMLILFSTRGFKDNKRGILYFGILIFISVVGYSSLSNFEKNKGVITIQERKSIDSIVKIKVDSIYKNNPTPIKRLGNIQFKNQE